MSNKLYAVASPKEHVGIYKTWDECQSKVIGVKGARYKSFKYLEDAQKFIEENSTAKPSKKQKKKAKQKDHDIQEEDICLYVDGSFKGNSSTWGFAVVQNGEALYWECGETENFTKHSNISAEFEAVIQGLNWCENKGVEEISLFYDYVGIEAIATGEHKAKTDNTRIYKGFMDQKGDMIKNYVKIQSHTGDYWNEKVDFLARMAMELGATNIEKYHNGQKI